MCITGEYSERDTDWERLTQGLAQYEKIMGRLHEVDVSADSDFQRQFNHFYRIRQKPASFYTTLYEFLEENKRSDAICFEEVLEHFFRHTGGVEPSFSSKVVATVRNDQPVWDSEVLRRFGLPKSWYHRDPEVRKNRVLQIFYRLNSLIIILVNSRIGQQMLAAFDAHFPQSRISDVKKIDLVLWQTRNLVLQVDDSCVP